MNNSDSYVKKMARLMLFRELKVVGDGHFGVNSPRIDKKSVEPVGGECADGIITTRLVLHSGRYTGEQDSDVFPILDDFDGVCDPAAPFLFSPDNV